MSDSSRTRTVRLKADTTYGLVRTFVEALPVEEPLELIGDRDVVQIGVHEMGVAEEADVREMQDLGVSLAVVDGLLEQD